MHRLKLWWLLFSVVYATCVSAQCKVVSDTAGTLLVGAQTINYSVKLSGGSTMIKYGGPDSACGILFPLIDAPWSGNVDSVTTVSYLFSSPISKIDVIVAYVGVYSLTRPESFTVATNSGIPNLVVNSGTCATWIINGNTLSSPNVLDAMNVIVTVSTSSPFTSLSIISDSISSTHGGSQFGLCDEVLFTAINEHAAKTGNAKFYPNPANGKLTIEHSGGLHDKLEIYDLLGQKIKEVDLALPKTYEVDLSDVRPGTYVAKTFVNGRVKTDRLLIQ